MQYKDPGHRLDRTLRLRPFSSFHETRPRFPPRVGVLLPLALPLSAAVSRLRYRRDGMGKVLRIPLVAVLLMLAGCSSTSSGSTNLAIITGKRPRFGQVFSVLSGSMPPTLPIGDHVHPSRPQDFGVD